jgi:hypothetical protein
MKRHTLVPIIAAIAVGLLGMAMFVSAIQQHDQETRTLGLLLIAFAALAVAIPLYVDARRIQAQHAKRPAQKREGLPCAGCGTEVAGFWCTTHMQRLCANCVPKHDEPARCLYKSLLRTAVRANRASA